MLAKDNLNSSFYIQTKTKNKENPTRGISTKTCKYWVAGATQYLFTLESILYFIISEQNAHRMSFN